VVDRDAKRGADLILAPVAATDRASLVVLGLEERAQSVEDFARELGLAVLADQRQDGDLHRGHLRVQAQDGARLAFDHLFVIGVDEKGQRRPVRPGRRLDHVRYVALARGLVEVFELLARELGVAREVEVAAVGDPLEL
jgi:hypothetical protein